MTINVDGLLFQIPEGLEHCSVGCTVCTAILLRSGMVIVYSVLLC
jgi:hypothetical protein